jgi:hypothetical protein
MVGTPLPPFIINDDLPAHSNSTKRRSSILNASLGDIGEAVRRFSLSFRRSTIEHLIYEHDGKDEESSSSTNERKSNDMLSQLTLEELELAACTSHEYLLCSKKKQRQLEEEDNYSNSNIPAAVAETAKADKMRYEYAKCMALRYLESKKGKVDVALKKLQATLQFRKEIDIVGLVQSFDNNHDDDDKNIRHPYALPLYKQLESKNVFVQGYDKEGRATYIFIPRLVQGHDAEWTLKEALYTMERAIACSKASDHTINAIVDFNGFQSLKHAPPLNIGQEFLSTLRSHYAGQVHRIFLLDAPSSFSFLWALLKNFVGTTTRHKIQFVSGKKQKEKMMSEFYDKKECPTWMRPDGQKNRDLDVQEYLYQIPFHQAFDETF